MIVLVTGGSGFIGRHVVARLSRSHEVLAPSHAELDLTDADATRRWLAGKNVDVVVHAAVKPGHRNAPNVTSLTSQNLRQFFAILRCRDAFDRLVIVSSGAVYGAQRPIAGVREEDLGEVLPADEHGFSKYVEALELQHDGNAVELRPFGVFGPGEDYAIRFISNACCKALLGLPVTLRRDRRFSYVWVEDLAAVVEKALKNERSGGLAAGAYNVTPLAPVRLRELADMVVAVSGEQVPVRVAEAGMGPDYFGDGSKLHAALPGWTPASMAEGVRRLHDWYAEHRQEIDREVLLTDR
jgi:UDP-glucose 4-epimerase